MVAESSINLGRNHRFEVESNIGPQHIIPKHRNNEMNSPSMVTRNGVQNYFESQANFGTFGNDKNLNRPKNPTTNGRFMNNAFENNSEFSEKNKRDTNFAEHYVDSDGFPRYNQQNPQTFNQEPSRSSYQGDNKIVHNIDNHNQFVRPNFNRKVSQSGNIDQDGENIQHYQESSNRAVSHSFFDQDGRLGSINIPNVQTGSGSRFQQQPSESNVNQKVRHTINNPYQNVSNQAHLNTESPSFNNVQRPSNQNNLQNHSQSFQKPGSSLNYDLNKITSNQYQLPSNKLSNNNSFGNKPQNDIHEDTTQNQIMYNPNSDEKEVFIDESQNRKTSNNPNSTPNGSYLNQRNSLAISEAKKQQFYDKHPYSKPLNRGTYSGVPQKEYTRNNRLNTYSGNEPQTKDYFNEQSDFSKNRNSSNFNKNNPKHHFSNRQSNDLQHQPQNEEITSRNESINEPSKSFNFFDLNRKATEGQKIQSNSQSMPSNKLLNLQNPQISHRESFDKILFDKKSQPRGVSQLDAHFFHTLNIIKLPENQDFEAEIDQNLAVINEFIQKNQLDKIVNQIIYNFEDQDFILIADQNRENQNRVSENNIQKVSLSNNQLVKKFKLIRLNELSEQEVSHLAEIRFIIRSKVGQSSRF